MIRVLGLVFRGFGVPGLLWAKEGRDSLLGGLGLQCSSSLRPGLRP